MPITRYFTSQSFDNLGLALQQIVRFLVNDHVSITGPAWSIVEAWDAGESELEIPGDSSDMDTFSSVISWRGGSVLNVGDWIVLESANANNSNHFQLYFEYSSATSVNLMLIPFEDFITGNSMQSPAFFPTSSFGTSSGSFVTLNGFSSNATYSCVADEGMAMFLCDNDTTSVEWTYIGEVDAIHTSGTHADTRCYVIWDAPSSVGLHDTSADVRLNRLSPIDNTTVLTNGYFIPLYLWGPNNQIHNTGVVTGALGHMIFPPGAYFHDDGHSHFAGWPRNLYSVHEDIGGGVARGTISGSNFVFVSNQTEPKVGMAWDETPYGSDFSGTLVIPPVHLQASLSGTFYENFMGEVYHEGDTIFYISGTTTYPFVTGSSGGGGTTINVISGSFVTGTIDRNRLRITYPAIRRSPRPADIIEQTVIVT